MVGVGTTTYTVGTIMERLYQQFLTPPDAQDAHAMLDTGIDDTTQTVILGTFVIPEDEALLRQGSILEIEQELIRVTSWVSGTLTATVERGIYGTVAVAHTVPNRVTLNPPYTRASVWESVNDNIRTLYPRLFTVVDEYVSSFEFGVFPVGDALAIEVMEIWSEHYPAELEWQGRIVNSHPSVGGRATRRTSRTRRWAIRSTGPRGCSPPETMPTLRACVSDCTGTATPR